MKLIFTLAAVATLLGTVTAGELSLRDQARQSLRRGVEFFRAQVSLEGTYLWEYSEDLSKREGEGVATSTQGWVQPPGTPAVGSVFLDAYEAVGDADYLAAASETAQGLAQGQLRSGGWTYSIDFSPGGSQRNAYRDGGKANARNHTTLDDDTTQSALRFLMRFDEITQFREANIREVIHYALTSLLKAQYPNGAWPQGYAEFPDPSMYPVKKAAYPDTWSRSPDNKQYWNCYTFNDNALADMIQTMSEASRIYKVSAAGKEWNALADQCQAAAEKAGDFILLAQMPEPQPAWAQQYNADMHPCWARKFEPPSVTGGESQGVMKILLNLYRQTGQRKYLEPLPRALDYLRRSRLPTGQLARFYELRSNRPLYFTRDYQLTFDDSDMPTHYSFQVTDGTESIRREYERLSKADYSTLKQSNPSQRAKATSDLIAQVKSVIAAQDAQGRWVEGGGLRYHRPKDPKVRVIRSSTFVRNVKLLSQFLAADE